MGFPSIFSCVLAPKPLAVLVVLLDRIRLLVSAPLFYLGFYFAGDLRHTLLPAVPFADPAASDGDHAYRLSAADLPLPLLPAAPSSIKRRLRVVQFQKLAEATPPAGLGGNEAEGKEEEVEEEEGEHVCAVCLCGLAAGDEVIRELGNCRHAFHRGCIDRWVDQGRPTCPLCRARLLPRRWERRESWVAESISYLLGKELLGVGGRRR